MKKKQTLRLFLISILSIALFFCILFFLLSFKLGDNYPILLRNFIQFFLFFFIVCFVLIILGFYAVKSRAWKIIISFFISIILIFNIYVVSLQIDEDQEDIPRELTSFYCSYRIIFYGNESYSGNFTVYLPVLLNDTGSPLMEIYSNFGGDNDNPIMNTKFGYALKVIGNASKGLNIQLNVDRPIYPRNYSMEIDDYPKEHRYYINYDNDTYEFELGVMNVELKWEYNDGYWRTMEHRFKMPELKSGWNSNSLFWREDEQPRIG